MTRLLMMTTALVLAAGAASAQDKVLNVLDWGGAFGESHAKAYTAPFEEKTGIKITVTDADNPAVPIKSMVEAGNVPADVASVEYADADNDDLADDLETGTVEDTAANDANVSEEKN